MNFEYNQSQQMFKRSLRDFLEKEHPRTVVREIEDKQLDYSREVYKKMAELGWLGIMIPEGYGGTGGDWVDMAIFYEEVGRALLQSPHYPTVVIGGQLILTLGSDEQKCSLLPQIAQGKQVYAFALSEFDPSLKLSSFTTIAERDDSQYVVSGRKLFVSYAHVADRIIVVARSKGSSGATLLLVDKGSPGLSYTALETMSGEKLSEVVLDNVAVSNKSMLAKAGQYKVITEILDKAQVMACAEALGGIQMSLEMLVEYSKQRIIFGHPIGAFQALQHKMADMAIAIESARWLVYTAAWMSSQRLPCDKERTMARFYTAKICPLINEDVVHCYGAASLVRDHDLTLYFRRAKAAQLNLGFYESFDKAIAKHIGL